MNMLNLTVHAMLALPLVVLAANNLLAKQTARKIALYVCAAVAFFQIASSVTLFVMYTRYGITYYDFNIFDPGQVSADYFSVNRLDLFLMVCIGIVVFVSVMLALETIKDHKRSYVNLLMCLLLGMNGMVMATDLFSLYVFLEIVGITSFVMIAMFRSKVGLEGSFKYLVVSSLGIVLLLSGLALIFMQTGTLDFKAIGESLLDTQDSSRRALTYSAVVLMISGFAVKAGAVPFHSWLPDAHQSADTAVSVLLSGIVIKIAGIYGLIVVLDLFGSLEAVRIIYQVIGLVSIITGAVLAARQHHFKRIAAYSSVSQMGYIILALSSGTTLGVVGAAAHIFSHAIFKSTLFSNAAAIHEEVGVLDVTKLGGLEKKMPITAFSSVIAFLSTAGVPPFCGFWSKLLIVIALWKSGDTVWAGAALAASIFTAVYFLRLQRKVFFGKLADGMQNVHEAKNSIGFIEAALTAVTVGAGLLFPFALQYLQTAGII